MYRNSIIYLIMVVVILALVFVPTTWFDKMLEDDVNGFRSRIDDILDTRRDAPELEEKCGLLQADWEKHMEHWSFFLNHSAMEIRISNTDIARGGAVLYEPYRKHAG